MNQTQCPNCRSYKVTDLYRKASFGLMGCLLIPGFIIVMFFWLFIGQGMYVNAFIAIGLWALAYAIGDAFNKPTKNQYSCDNCGYIWKGG